MSEKHQEVFRVAQELYRQAPDWVTFFREVLGLDGIVRKMYSSPDDLAEFEQTATYKEIQQMLAKLRVKHDGSADPQEPTRVITIRLPKSLHDALRAEAHGHHTSMNKLCISKLVQLIDGELVPVNA